MSGHAFLDPEKLKDKKRKEKKTVKWLKKKSILISWEPWKYCKSGKMEKDISICPHTMD